MKRFNSKIGAGALVGFGLVYMVASLATGRSATAKYPPDLAVDNAQLEISVWQTAELLIREKDTVHLIDVRAPEEYATYHVPKSINKPSYDSRQVADIGAKNHTVIVVAGSDEKAGALVTDVRRLSGKKNIYYLREGAGSWYLSFDLPISLFSDEKPPYGYTEALATVRNYFDKDGRNDPEAAQNALATLVRLNYEPTKLGKKRKPKASGKKRKKIAGGCG